MNIQQAIQQGITKLRLPSWNKSAYLEIHILNNGQATPWATLHDPVSHQGRDVPEPLLIMQLESDEYLAYTEQKNEHDQNSAAQVQTL